MTLDALLALGFKPLPAGWFYEIKVRYYAWEVYIWRPSTKRFRRKELVGSAARDGDTSNERNDLDALLAAHNNAWARAAAKNRAALYVGIHR